MSRNKGKKRAAPIKGFICVKVVIIYKSHVVMDSVRDVDLYLEALVCLNLPQITS